MHVADLAESFGVSEMTVRRDLRQLADAGRLERVRGGAVNVSNERPFDVTAVESYDAKRRIGAAAAERIEDGQTVMLDIGTTTLEAAKCLHGREVTVITTSLAVFDELRDDPAIELILPGGILRRNYRSLIGVVAEDSLRQLNADVLLLGTSAVDQRLDVWDSTMVEVPIKRAMIGASESVVLLADQQNSPTAGTCACATATCSTRSSPTWACRRPTTGPSKPPASRSGWPHEAEHRRRRRLPRAARLRSAALARGRARH